MPSDLHSTGKIIENLNRKNMLYGFDLSTAEVDKAIKIKEEKALSGNKTNSKNMKKQGMIK